VRASYYRVRLHRYPPARLFHPATQPDVRLTTWPTPVGRTRWGAEAANQISGPSSPPAHPRSLTQPPPACGRPSISHRWNSGSCLRARSPTGRISRMPASMQIITERLGAARDPGHVCTPASHEPSVAAFRGRTLDDERPLGSPRQSARACSVSSQAHTPSAPAVCRTPAPSVHESSTCVRGRPRARPSGSVGPPDVMVPPPPRLDTVRPSKKEHALSDPGQSSPCAWRVAGHCAPPGGATRTSGWTSADSTRGTVGHRRPPVVDVTCRFPRLVSLVRTSTPRFARFIHWY
jgi:hypothetical protein